MLENMVQEIPGKVKLLHPDAKVPTYADEEAAGCDIYSIEDHEFQPGETYKISTGIAIEIRKGKVLLLWDRSGMGSKGIPKYAGVIDSNYRGELKVVLHNSTDRPYRVSKGDKIVQGICQDYYRVLWETANELSDTSRGSGGFGSTGK